MNKSIFVLTVIGAIAAAMVASTVIVSIPNVSATRCDNPRACGNGGDPADPRTTYNLDTHIAKGGEHGNKALEIKESRNGCSGPSCGGDGGPSLPR
jgi:hypothetical protein